MIIIHNVFYFHILYLQFSPWIKKKPMTVELVFAGFTRNKDSNVLVYVWYCKCINIFYEINDKINQISVKTIFK